MIENHYAHRWNISCPSILSLSRIWTLQQYLRVIHKLVVNPPWGRQAQQVPSWPEQREVYCTGALW